MRRFNPEKELYKIQHRNRNKVIAFVSLLLVVSVISYSFALYQVRYSKRIIYTKVGEFYHNDVVLSVYIDGEKKTEPNSFPDKDSGKIFSHVTCKNGGTGYFDNKEWKLKIETTEQDRCDVYFVTGNLPNEPELFQGMIPVTFSDTGVMYVADTSSDWYNYQDHRWANAVLVDASNATIKNKYFKADNTLRDDIIGKEVPMEEVLQMYVWIPRYKYKIFSLGNTDTPKQIIEIVFEKGEESTGDFECTYEINIGTVTESCPGIDIGKWYTHPAFTFGETNLKGFWVGKFEPSDAEDETGRNRNNIGEITILPGKTSMTYKKISVVFFAEQDLVRTKNKYNLNSDTTDTRITKNSEWGAIAYLTNSKYGIYTNDGQGCIIDSSMTKETCEVWVNNTQQTTEEIGGLGGTYTGCVGDMYNSGMVYTGVTQCAEANRWNTGGVKASTTGNIYGIYDMVGGAWEYVMGVMIDKDSREVAIVNSGFTLELDQPNTLPNAKYYDIYTYNENALTYTSWHYGDATKETLDGLEQNLEEWDSGFASFPNSAEPWFIRGSSYSGGIKASIFAISRTHVGGNNWFHSFRSVLSHT